jgi:outer membrane lipoprotein-sorting protein
MAEKYKSKLNVRSISLPLMVSLAILLPGNLILALEKTAEPLTAAQVFDQVVATYQGMSSYQSTGTVLSEIETESNKIHTQTAFTMLLKKPNQYLVRWTRKNMPTPNTEQHGAVWSDGKQPYLYIGAMKAYGKMGSDEMALGGAMGVSGGCVYTIPSMYLSVFKDQPHPFSRLQEPKIETSEIIGDEECYVIHGASTISKKETFWISKSRFLVMKYRRSLEPPDGGVTIPEMTDQQVAEALQGLGQEVTDESMKKMRSMMEKSKTLFENAQMKGFMTELHENISSPELKPENFQFTIPEGTELKESLLGGMLGGKE